MLYVQEYLKNHTLDELHDEFDIKIKEYDDRVVLNYNIKSPKYHPICIECRSLILSLPDYKILSRSFDRFFNYGEGDDHLSFDWEHAIAYNKYDGSIINVYHDGVSWCVSTKGTAFAEATTSMDITYYDLFCEVLDGVSLETAFEYCDKKYSFIFELVSPKNRIVTRYEKTDAVLIGIRNKETGKYNSNLQDRFVKMGLPFAKISDQYSLNSFEDVIDFVESRNEMDEGCVLWDCKNDIRIKIKNSSYVAIHHLRGNEVTKKSILTLILKGEITEYLNYFPEDKEMIQVYVDKCDKLCYDIIQTYERYKEIESQKEFALNVKDLPYSGFLFSMRKGVKFDDMCTVENLNRFLKFFE